MEPGMSNDVEAAREADSKAQADLRTSLTLGVEGPALRDLERKARSAEGEFADAVRRARRS
jgi:hypothetical protein